MDVVECPDDLRPALAAAAVQGRRGRRPGRGAVAGRRRRRPHRGHPRRRPARRPLRRRRLVQPAEPDRGAGGRRRGDRAAHHRRAHARAAHLRRLHARARARGGAGGGSTSRWPSCTSPTRPWPRWPRSSASTARRPATPGPRPPASTRRSPPPRRRATATSRGSPSSSRGSSAAEDAPDEEPDTTRCASGSPTSPAPRRAAEMEARLALRTTEERARALHGRADSLLKAAQAERDARAAAIARREQLQREGRVGEAVGRGVAVVLARLEESIASASAERTRVEQGRAGASRSCARHGSGCATSAATSTSWSTPCTATRWPAPSSGCGSSSSRSGRSRSSASTPRRWSPTTAPTSWCPFSGEVAEGEETPEPVPFDREEQSQAAAHRRAGAGPARPDQPAGARGVLGAGGAAQVPHRAARGPQEHPQGPPRHRPRGRRARRAGLHRGVRRRRARPSTRPSPGSSPAARDGSS